MLVQILRYVMLEFLLDWREVVKGGRVCCVQWLSPNLWTQNVILNVGNVVDGPMLTCIPNNNNNNKNKTYICIKVFGHSRI